MLQCVGEGIHASVSLANLRTGGDQDTPPTWQPVAVKQFRYHTQPAPPPRVVQTFRDEVFRLRGLSHPHIVAFKGLMLRPRLAIVTEYVGEHRCETHVFP